ncbi:MAG: hypothetical protein ACW99G_02645 [Candidatus Thorarchaeota archaeon]|jgi:hypothetical protein
MCTAQAEEFIVETVDEFVNGDILFTAFDISLKVQSKLASANLPRERHLHLKNQIHREVQPFVDQNLYEQTLHDVGAPSKAFLYHPIGVDANTYTPHKRNDGNKQAPPAPVAIPTAKPQPTVSTAPQPQGFYLANDEDDEDDGDGQDTSGRETDQRGSLTVPSFLLRIAQFSPGDIAYVTPVDDKSFVVSKRPVAGKSPLKATYTTNSNVNVRVTASSLTACGFSPSDKFDFEQKQDQVVVSLHEG